MGNAVAIWNSKKEYLIQIIIHLLLLNQILYKRVAHFMPTDPPTDHSTMMVSLRLGLVDQKIEFLPSMISLLLACA